MKGKQLSAEDRILWSRVARATKPLPGKSIPEGDIPAPPAVAGRRKAESGAQPVPPSPPVPAEKPRPRKLDAPTREKLARGRLEIAGRVDLHGLTQEEAHVLLLSFLRRAYEADRRYVLVITGKGSSTAGKGVLRQAVPQWLSTPPFRIIVGGYEEAARNHGGSGALYVRLRRAGGRQ